MLATSCDHPIETPVRHTPLKIGTTTATKLLKRHFNKSGSALKNLIYDRLPDAVDRPWRTEI
jgi:hypothetical protein